MGDLNFNVLKATTNSQFFRILSKFNLQNIIVNPTRVTNTSSSCFDLIITNHSAIITNSNVLPPFNTDNCTITAEITFKTYKAVAYKNNMEI